MKMISMLVTLLGALALLLGVVGRVLGHAIVTVSPGGYLRGADTLLLLALAIMVYGRFHCAKPPAQT